MSAALLKALWIYGLAAAVAALIATVIKFIVFALGWRGRRHELPAGTAASTAAGASAAAANGAASADDAAPIPAHVVAAIAAAVSATLGERRVLRIDDLHSGATWAAQGRAAHHRSHTVPTRHPPR